MKRFDVEISKEMSIVVLDEKTLLGLYSEFIDSEGCLFDAIRYIATCVVSDQPFDDLVDINMENNDLWKVILKNDFTSDISEV